MTMRAVTGLVAFVLGLAHAGLAGAEPLAWVQVEGETPVVFAAPFSINASPTNGLTISAAGGFGGGMYLRLRQRLDQPFGVGAHEDTSSESTNRGAYMELDLPNSMPYCGGGQQGRFAVREVLIDAGVVATLALDFETTCSGRRVFGEVRVGTSVPLSADRGAGWASPGPMAFTSASFATPGATTTSRATTVYGITASAPVSIVDGEYSVNDGPFTSAPGTVSNRDRVRVRRAASAAAGESVAATLTVGGVDVPFIVSTWTTGSAVSAMWIDSPAGAPLFGERTIMMSPPQWVLTPTTLTSTLLALLASGPGELLQMEIRPRSGDTLHVGAYELTGISLTLDHTGCGGGRFVVLEAVPAGSTFASLAIDFQHACADGAPSSFGELRINSAVPFTFQKPPGSTLPNAFSFAPRSGLAPGTMVDSDWTTIYGINAPAGISIQGGEYSINDGAFTSNPGTVSNKDRLRVRTTAGAAGTVRDAIVDVGGRTATFRVASYAAGDPINAIHVEGANPFDAAAPDWTFTMSGNLAGGGVDVVARGPASAFWSARFVAPTDQRLEVGSSYELAMPVYTPASAMLSPSGCSDSGRFVVLDIAYATNGSISRFAVDWESWCNNGTTSRGEIRINSAVPLRSLKPAGSTLPHAFAFIDRELAYPGASVTSNLSSLLGTNAPMPVSISGGEYSLNGAPFTTQAGTAQFGDDIALRVRASTTPGGAREASVNVGGRIATFRVTTRNPGVPVTALAIRQPGLDDRPSPFIVAAPAVFQSYPTLGNMLAIQFYPRGAFERSLTISNDSGNPPAAGIYPNAQRFFSPGHPALDFIGGCNQVAGSFVVHEAMYGPSGFDMVKRISLDWEERCEIVGLPLRAQLRIDSMVPMTRFGAPTGRKAKGFDANADGRVDMLWRRPDGTHALTLMDGNATVAESALLGPGTGWSAVLTGDFDGDGKGDIVWRHDDGRIAIWLMDGPLQAGGGIILVGSTGWEPRFTGDFNGDGKSDIVWVHPDGRSALWLMDGARQVGGGVLLPAGTGWWPRLLADFDGDGKRDIVWEHNDGSWAIWTMDGARQVGGGRLFAGGTGWSARVIADLDGNGKSDIVWRHQDGRLAVWMMDSFRQVGGAVIAPAGSGLTPLLGGDLDGDGKDDIVMRHDNTALVAWTMDGTRRKASLDVEASLNAWLPRAIGDYDADGRADVVSVHADGRVRLDSLEAGAFIPYRILGPGAGWQAILP